jgi:predicted O-methyltransferase YrrM
MATGFMTQETHSYLDQLVPPRHPEMQTMEAYAREHKFPIIGPAAGHFCYLMTRLAGARRVFEMGSGYGYSTAWFARGVQENGGGTVFHVVWDEGLSTRARGHLGRLGYDGMIEYRVGEATEALRKTDGPFDVIFIDIDKHGYPEAFKVAGGKLRSGGIIIVDNTLWSGRIFDPAHRDANGEGIRELTRRATTDAGWISSIVPIRDGLLIANKK